MDTIHAPAALAVNFAGILRHVFRPEKSTKRSDHSVPAMGLIFFQIQLFRTAFHHERRSSPHQETGVLPQHEKPTRSVFQTRMSRQKDILYPLSQTKFLPSGESGNTGSSHHQTAGGGGEVKKYTRIILRLCSIFKDISKDICYRKTFCCSLVELEYNENEFQCQL
jgi:hypothetical protein